MKKLIVILFLSTFSLWAIDVRGGIIIAGNSLHLTGPSILDSDVFYDVITITDGDVTIRNANTPLIYFWGESNIDIFGGDMSGLVLRSEDSMAYVHGKNYRMIGNTLHGDWLTGEPFEMMLCETNNFDVMNHFVLMDYSLPEPTTCCLLILGCLCMRKKR